MKKLIATTLLTALTCCLTACDGNSEQDTSQTTSPLQTQATPPTSPTNNAAVTLDAPTDNDNPTVTDSADGMAIESLFLNPDEYGAVIGSGSINRVEWLAMLNQAAKLKASDYVRYELSSFADVDTSNPWFETVFPHYDGEVEVARQNNVIPLAAPPEDGDYCDCTGEITCNRLRVPPSGEYYFYPMSSATQVYAVVTAVNAMGFFGFDCLGTLLDFAVGLGVFEGVPGLGNLTQSQAEVILSVVNKFARTVQ
jgi:hypothetical protein